MASSSAHCRETPSPVSGEGWGEGDRQLRRPVSEQKRRNMAMRWQFRSLQVSASLWIHRFRNRHKRNHLKVNGTFASATYSPRSQAAAGNFSLTTIRDEPFLWRFCHPVPPIIKPIDRGSGIDIQLKQIARNPDIKRIPNLICVYRIAFFTQYCRRLP